MIARITYLRAERANLLRLLKEVQDATAKAGRADVEAGHSAALIHKIAHMDRVIAECEEAAKGGA